MDNKNLSAMTCEEIYGMVDSRMVEALMFHSDMMIYFDFLGLDGYSKKHEYQYFKESKGRKCFQRFIMDTTNKIVCEHNIKNPHAIPEEWYKHTRMDVGSNVLSKSVKEGFEKYKKWEEETLTMFEMIAAEFLSRGRMIVYDKILEYCVEVSKELSYIYKDYENLVTTEFDWNYIMDRQKKEKDCAEKKLAKLFE